MSKLVRKIAMNSSSATSTMQNSSKQTKKVAKKDETAATPAPVAAPTPAPVEAKKASKKVASKSETPAPAPAPVAPAVPAVTEATPEAPVQTVGDEIRGMVSTLTTMRETISALYTQLKKLEKRVAREIKDARKRKRRVRTEGADGQVVPAKPSIFQIPTKLSDELCVFLGKPKGSEMSRSNVTKAVTTYIKEKDLKNKHDITPDAPLRKLLGVPSDQQLTYFNLQKYLNKHYVKAEKPAATH
jgi:chromatin remodeling complex protein RSC6